MSGIEMIVLSMMFLSAFGSGIFAGCALHEADHWIHSGRR